MNDRLKHDVLCIFEQLSRIPRESGHEQEVSDRIKDWAQKEGLEVSQDDLWNLVICKQASPGYGDHPPVMLQAHIDMVCEKDSDSTHDFSKDPILLKIEDDWITSATGTTLGADNGIGVAAAMAILKSTELKHPPLEVVFTVQEETTFAGAENIDVSGLKSRRLINLDHSDEHELIVGSCGGVGVEWTMPLKRNSSSPEDQKLYRLRLSGLKGGHSGEDIHRGRGNAIVLLMRALEQLQLPVTDIRGGSNRLAIPREAEATVYSADEVTLQKTISELEETLRKELADAGSDLMIACDPTEGSDPIPPLDGESLSRIAAIIRLYPNGIVNMNGSLEGVVESSDNIGIISTEDDRLRLVSEIRGGHQSSVEDIQKTIDLLAVLFSAKASYFNAYVPWEFAADSAMRTLATNTYRELFGEEMRQLALHAGLECGFFAKKIPGMDIISIGPDCENFHSPKERVRISSIERFYEFLTTLLARL